jgi:HlyD family secretion protein
MARRKDGHSPLRRLWLIIAALAVAIVLLLLLRKSEPPALPFARVKRATLVSTLPTNGKVEPLEWQAVRAESSGVITSVPVKDGQSVVQGAIIARISLPGADQQLQGAEARAAQYQSDLATLHRGGATAQIAEINAAIAKAQFDRDVAQRDFDALTRLNQKQAATDIEVLLARQRREAADLSIKTLTQRRNSLVSANDIAAGEARLHEAQAQAETFRAKLDTGVVRAPIPGTVYSLPARPGAYVNLGDLIANVGNLDQLRVRVFVDEPELGRIRVGMPVKISWDGLPGRFWDGSVERMPTEIVPLGSRQVGEVWVTIQNAQHDLVPGTTINAEIRTDVSPDALLIPKSAIRHDRVPIGVFVLRQGRLAWQPITTGPSDITNTVVRSGLAEGEPILLPTDTPVKEGDRAREHIQ